MGDEHDLDLGIPGASARREHQRRREKRNRRTLDRHPRLGRLRLAFQDPPQHERRYETGAEAEELVAEALRRRCPTAVVLHDRRTPLSRANIDHIAVAASGVWVIDAKRYTGRVRVTGPLLAQPRLKVGGRDRTKLVTGLDKQVAAVRAALADVAPHVSVHGCLCFVGPRGMLSDSGLPLLGTRSVNGYSLFSRRMLAKSLNKPASLGYEQARLIAAALARAFPRA